MILFGYLLITGFMYAQAYISIKVPNTSIDYGKTDISISCKVNGTFLKSIAVIKLKRSNTEIVAISGSVVQWTDNQLQTRSKVNASTKDVLSSYLHLKIMACDVNNTIDQETYQCELTALKQNGPVITPVSKKVYLNITGDHENCAIPNITVFSQEPNVFLIILAMLLSTCYYIT